LDKNKIIISSNSTSRTFEDLAATVAAAHTLGFCSTGTSYSKLGYSRLGRTPKVLNTAIIILMRDKLPKLINTI